MRAKPVYVVHRSGNGPDWAVKQAGRILSEHYLKDRAIGRGKVEARKDSVDLVIQNRHGVIVSKDSYGDETPKHDYEH